jgi:hypothetical protein
MRKFSRSDCTATGTTKAKALERSKGEARNGPTELHRFPRRFLIPFPVVVLQA